MHYARNGPNAVENYFTATAAAPGVTAIRLAMWLDCS